MKRRSKLRLDVEDTLTLRQGNGRKHGWKLLAGHRGGAAEACENTIGAFEKAIKLGLNFMECDVQLSKDG
jgi:glycerophosphoryl diester phosphodiesterase